MNKAEKKTLGKARYLSTYAISVEEYFNGSSLNSQHSKDWTLDLLQAVKINEIAESQTNMPVQNIKIVEIN